MDDVYLTVYLNRSELHENNELNLVFEEGVVSEEAKKRYVRIKSSLEDGFLDGLITGLINGDISTSDLLSEEQMNLLGRMVDSVTSEVGRALVAITIMQLTVKSIIPEQSIMLHKGSSSTGSFSWKEGISMRSLDKYYITPVLRKYDLVRLNADGFMMTRSLAENYPYSKVYKAKLRGAREEWLEIVSMLEKKQLNPEEALKYCLSLLINRADNFNKLADKTLKAVNSSNIHSLNKVLQLIEKHIETSSYKARLFEIAIHSFFQALNDLHSLDGLTLQPLSQMRSANKKHGNIGDVELSEGSEIVVSWDAKYGKEYLRDEIEELYEKISGRTDNIREVGFIVNSSASVDDEITARINEIFDLTGHRIEIIAFGDWVKRYLSGRTSLSEDVVGDAWLKAYSESLAQKRRNIAPIDEPCNAWLESLLAILDKKDV